MTGVADLEFSELGPVPKFSDLDPDTEGSGSGRVPYGTEWTLFEASGFKTWCNFSHPI